MTSKTCKRIFFRKQNEEIDFQNDEVMIFLREVIHSLTK